MFIFISLKTEIARSASGPKLQGLHAEDAIGGAVPRAEEVGRIKFVGGDQRGIWKGDVLIADLEELETMDASEI